MYIFSLSCALRRTRVGGSTVVPRLRAHLRIIRLTEVDITGPDDKDQGS